MTLGDGIACVTGGTIAAAGPGTARLALAMVPKISRAARRIGSSVVAVGPRCKRSATSILANTGQGWHVLSGPRQFLHHVVAKPLESCGRPDHAGPTCRALSGFGVRKVDADVVAGRGEPRALLGDAQCSFRRTL